MRPPRLWAIPSTPFTLAHVAPLGVTHHHIAGSLKRGALTRLRQGVYINSAAVPADLRALHALHALAEQVAVPSRVASHQSAALCLGLPLLWSERAAAGPVRMTIPTDPRSRGRGRSTLQTTVAPLPAHHLLSLPSGLVVTSPARTAVDLAAELDLPEALMVLDAALRTGLADLVGGAHRSAFRDARATAAAMDALQEAATLVAPRAARARVATALGLASPLRESPLESWSCAHFHLAGLPAPTLQARIRTPLGDFFADCAWESYRVIGEADGEGKYADSSAFAREKERETLLRDEGWNVVRWTGHEAFATPRRVVERVERVLAAAGWPG